MSNNVDSRTVAASLVFKLNSFARELEAKPTLTPSEKRHLIAVKTLSLIALDRNRSDRAKKLNGRA